jgi:hypothetical protein
LRKQIPMTYWAMMMIGTLALTGVGIPYIFGFAGFFSKDAIIEAPCAHNPAANNLPSGCCDRGVDDVVLFLAPDVHDLPRQAARQRGRDEPRP